MPTRINRDRLIAFLMILPSIILLFIFVYVFIGYTAWTSMTDSEIVQQLSGQTANFVGFQQYNSLFTNILDSRFRLDLVNTVFFTVLFIAACLGLGIALAILLDQKVKAEGTFRTIFLFPMALSFVVTGVVWKWLFNPTSGINAIPTFFGLPAGQFQWFVSTERILVFNWQDLPAILAIIALGVVVFFALRAWVKRRSVTGAILTAFALLLMAWISFGGPASLNGLAIPEYHGFNLALIALVVAAGWQMSGYTMAMYLAGLRGISEDLREAARVDGASEFGVYRHVVLPLLAPITLSAMIILGHISLKIFDLVYVMGGGDNLYIDMPGINMFFTTFRGGDFAKGAAIAIIMLIMVAAVIVPYLVTSLRKETEL
jgi:glucose/mannose transport system permease protein